MFKILDVTVPKNGEFITLVLEIRKLSPLGEKIEVERDLRKQEIDSLEFLFSQKEVGTEFESFDDFFNHYPRITCVDDDQPKLKYSDPLLARKKIVLTLPYEVSSKSITFPFKKTFIQIYSQKCYF